MEEPNRKSIIDIMALPKEIHHIIYDHMETHCDDQQLENQLVQNGYVSVTFSNMNLVKEWILKRTITIESMRKVNSYFKDNVEGYYTLKRPERPRDITLRFTWMEQLGQLLVDIGHIGRQKITSLDLLWNEWSHQPENYEFDSIWHRKDSSAKIFTLLSDCSNLRNLKLRIDPFTLAYCRVPWFRTARFELTGKYLFDLEGSKALRELRLGPGATIELQYENSVSSRSYFLPKSIRPPYDFLGWLERGMRRPREEQSVIYAKLKGKKLLGKTWEIYLESLLERELIVREQWKYSIHSGRKEMIKVPLKIIIALKSDAPYLDFKHRVPELENAALNKRLDELAQAMRVDVIDKEFVRKGVHEIVEAKWRMRSNPQT